MFLRNESCVVAQSCMKTFFLCILATVVSILNNEKLQDVQLVALQHCEGHVFLAVLEFQRAVHKPVKLQTCLLLTAWIFASITDSLDHGEGVIWIKICSVHF